MDLIRRHKALFAIGLLVVVAAAAAIFYFTRSDEPTGKLAYTGTPGKKTTVKFSNASGAYPLTTKDSSLGAIVAGQQERTLYSYKSAADKPIDCRGECAWQWLPVVVGVGVKISGEIEKSMVGAVKYSNGSTQLTYGGHPLYYFADDTKASSTTGNGKESFGVTWSAVAADGSLVK